MLSLKLSFMTANYCVNILIVFTEAFVIVCQMTQCNVLTVQCFYLRRNNGSLFLLSTRNKRVAITFHKNHTLNIGNQYHKDAPKIFVYYHFEMKVLSFVHLFNPRFIKFTLLSCVISMNSYNGSCNTETEKHRTIIRVSLSVKN